VQYPVDQPCHKRIPFEARLCVHIIFRESLFFSLPGNLSTAIGSILQYLGQVADGSVRSHNVLPKIKHLNAPARLATQLLEPMLTVDFLAGMIEKNDPSPVVADDGMESAFAADPTPKDWAR